MDRVWFRRRTIGLGFRPASWQGWLITLVMVAAVVGVLTAMHHSAARFPIVIAVFAAYAVVALATGGARTGADGPRDD